MTTQINPKTLIVSALILAQATISRADYSMDWHTITSGSNTTVNGAIQVAGTTGQVAIQNPTMSGGQFQLVGGFWTVAQVCHCPGDLTGDGQKDGDDVQLFANCMMSGGNCDCADVDGDNGVTAGDINAFVLDLIAGQACP